MSKSIFINKAKEYGVKATYSGTAKKMFISGEDSKVKSFIRICCLKGKDAYAFGFAKS